MQQAQATLDGIGKYLRDDLRLLSILQPDLRRLDVPVAELAPDEVIDLTASFPEEVAVQQTRGATCHIVQTAENPAIRQRQSTRRPRGPVLVHGDVVVGDRAQREPGGIPKLVSEVPARLHLLDAQATVIA